MTAFKGEIIDDLQDLILGRRPVKELFDSDITIERLIVRLGSQGKIVWDIIDLAKKRSIRIDRLQPEVFDKIYPPGAAGIAAKISACPTLELEELLEKITQSGKPPFLIILDGVEDPHNLGAIARSAEAAGCNGMILPQRNSAPLSQTAIKASAGALLRLPVAKVGNLNGVIKQLKTAGIWIYGAEMQGKDFRTVDYAQSAALVIGGEGGGLSRLVKENCDEVVAIPMYGKIASLNASVSAGIVLFQMAEKRSMVDSR